MISKQFPAKIFIIQSTNTQMKRLMARGRQTKWNLLQKLWSDAGVAAVPLTSEGRGWWPVARTGQRQPDTLNCAQAASSCDGPASEEAWGRTVRTHSLLNNYFMRTSMTNYHYNTIIHNNSFLFRVEFKCNWSKGHFILFQEGHYDWWKDKDWQR